MWLCHHFKFRKRQHAALLKQTIQNLSNLVQCDKEYYVSKATTPKKLQLQAGPLMGSHKPGATSQLLFFSAHSAQLDEHVEDDQLDEEFLAKTDEANAETLNTNDFSKNKPSLVPPSYQLKKKSMFLLNYIQASVSSGYREEAIAAVIERNPFLSQDMQSVEYLLQMLTKLPICSTNNVTELMINLFQKVLQSDVVPSPNACACMLAAMYRYNPDDQHAFLAILDKIQQLHSLDECLDACHPQGEAYKFTKSAITFYRPDYVFTHTKSHFDTPPLILTKLYDTKPLSGSLQLPASFSRDQIMSCFEEQLQMELRGSVAIPNVMSHGSPVSDYCMKQQQKLKVLHRRWSESALDAFRIMKEREERKWRHNNTLGVYPFLCLLSEQEYVDIIINHLYLMPKSGEITLTTVGELGGKVYSRYVLKHHLTTDSRAQLKTLYKNYLSLYFDKNKEGSVLRQKWQSLECLFGNMLMEGHISPWQNLWKMIVGSKLLEIMVSTFTVNVGNNSRVPSAYFKGIPAVYNSYKPWGNRIYGMTIPHPVYYDLVYSARGNFDFEPDLLPMVVPPMPWLQQNQGGFLCRPTDFVRKKFFSGYAECDLQSNSEQLCCVADALNVQGSVAWKVNTRVLDVQLKIFCANGDEKLKIAPPPPDVAAEFCRLRKHPAEHRKKLVAAYYRAKKRRNEMNSLHADALYKFSIANYYRDRLFWLPHNLDFRGRSYPVPPHFNYMGDDVSRSLFMFADGKALGKRGLEWLKIHVINLTGIKKYENLPARKEYAEQVLDEIIDSAEHPLDGRGWWKKSEDPWQTLAACMELVAALRSPDPEQYISHLAVYQDGSCNGLQHYAALGRDVAGAEQVNLKPSAVPQDVYTGVASAVERLRSKDAADGVEIARDLEGFISRKVVKQTVMTTVYGVTRYGGALQIKKQLVNLDFFPIDKCIPASAYLVNAIFQSISTIFTSATNIQIWLTEIAKCMSKGGKSVEWMTPLGLLSVQPYFKLHQHRINTNVQALQISSFSLLPNAMKQCNAFPPNFVHSLDSTHMMLTALHCYHSGLKFSAVHDCYWTHASTVDRMNELCRQQFIALHSQPILQDLADHLKRFLPGTCDNKQSERYIAPGQQERLRQLLTNIPEKGTFDLNLVENSVFFFS